MNDSTEKQSWWKRLSGGLKRTSASLGTAISDLVTKRKLDAATLEARVLANLPLTVIHDGR